MAISDQEIREELTPEEIRTIVRHVQQKRCPCCGSFGDEQLECGHYLCDLCVEREHECLACIVAT